MSYHQNNLNYPSISRQAASPQTRMNVHEVPPINTSIALPHNTVTSGSHWSPGPASPEQVSPATAMAALSLNPFAIPSPSATSTTSPAMAVHVLTHRVAQLEQQLQAAQQLLQVQTPAGTVNPAHLTLTNNMPPMATRATLRRPRDHQQRAERRKVLRKLFNRNGNRCCAWCEPRRERRKYGPRQVPDGEMTCGCTVEDALFEESLARNGVGSMDTTRLRLDPELRCALLALLKRRYKYQDGDLDFDHDTLEWEQGGDLASWMARAKFE